MLNTIKGNGTAGNPDTGAAKIKTIAATTDRDEFTEFVFPHFKTVVIDTRNRGLQSIINYAVDEFNDYIGSFLTGEKHA